MNCLILDDFIRTLFQIVFYLLNWNFWIYLVLKIRKENGKMFFQGYLMRFEIIRWISMVKILLTKIRDKNYYKDNFLFTDQVKVFFRKSTWRNSNNWWIHFMKIVLILKSLLIKVKNKLQKLFLLAITAVSSTTLGT